MQGLFDVSMQMEGKRSCEILEENIIDITINPHQFDGDFLSIVSEVYDRNE